MYLLVVLCFTIVGVVGLFSPATLLELTGSPGASPFARNEARAIYGGGGLTLALLLALAPWLEGGATLQWAIGLLCFARGITRGLSLLVEWPRVWSPLLYVALELAGAAILLQG